MEEPEMPLPRRLWGTTTAKKGLSRAFSEMGVEIKEFEEITCDGKR